MLDLIAVKELGTTFLWFLTLGKTDTKQIRAELQDLLSHSSHTLKSLGELTEALYKMKEQEFTEDSFLPIYFHCVNNYTSSEASRRARSHCTDIERDIERIQFRITKILRTKAGRWKSLDEAFKKIVGSDEDLLKQFEDDMNLVDKELNEIVNLLSENPKEAWRKYEQLRSILFNDIAEMKKNFNNMRDAEDHIRRVLT